ncbi:MAG TPA: DoxX family protein [Puia sp.]|nr:DoxX family protein [Puia sp.]
MIRRQDLAQLLLRLALGAGFLLAVADRFGFLGGPGSKGVSWGNWANFAGYTHTLLPFLSGGLASVMAGIATGLEIVFGVCLVIGLGVRLAAAGAALLTLIFGLCMAVFLGIRAPFGYPVFVFTGAAWVLATLSSYRWSVDELFNSRTHPRRHHRRNERGY